MGTTSRGYEYADSTDAPRVWEISQTLAESIDTDVAALVGAWSAYTPVLGAGGGAPTVGTTGAVVHGRYKEIGKTVHVEGGFTFGTGASMGTGAVTATLPVAAANITNAIWFGAAYFRDISAGGGGHFTGLCSVSAAGTTLGFFASSGNAQLSGTVPFTWVATDFMRWSLTYERA